MGKEEGIQLSAEHKKHKEKGRKERKHKDTDADREHKKRRKDDDDEEEEDSHHRKHKHRKKKDRHRDRKGEHEVEIIDDDMKDRDLREEDITMDGERVRVLNITSHFLTQFFSTQIPATDVPTRESLKITSRAETQVTDPPLSRTKSVLKRDEWMLQPSAAPDGRPQNDTVRAGAEQLLTEGYGEPLSDSRKLDGGIDFFANLGIEKKKPPRPDKPDPDKVFCFIKHMYYI